MIHNDESNAERVLWLFIHILCLKHLLLLLALVVSRNQDDIMSMYKLVGQAADNTSVGNLVTFSPDLSTSKTTLATSLCLVTDLVTSCATPLTRELPVSFFLTPSSSVSFPFYCTAIPFVSQEKLGVEKKCQSFYTFTWLCIELVTVNKIFRIKRFRGWHARSWVAS